MKFSSIVMLLIAMSLVPAYAATTSIVLTDVSYNHPFGDVITLDFQLEFVNITNVEITMTSNMGPVYICDGDYDWDLDPCWPCGNATTFFLDVSESPSGKAHLIVDGLGEIDHQTWSDWYYYTHSPTYAELPMTDWSFLNSGVTTFNFKCYADGCPIDWLHGEYTTGPDPYQIDEIVITVISDTVLNEPLAWGQLKALYR